MKKSIIDCIYTENECGFLRELFNEEEQYRDHIIRSVGDKLVSTRDFLTKKSLDVLYVICCSNKFTDLQESYKVACIIHAYIGDSNYTEPDITEEFNIILAEKVFVSLCFFKQHLNYKHRYKYKPSPEFYRKVAIKIFNKTGHEDIALHFTQWEDFFSERFI